MDRHLSPSETAKLFAASVKALRLYEQRGLLTPQRSGSGWRIYGPAQIARLHQIIALKRLGLTLARIGEILCGPDRLETILALQEQALSRDSEQLSRALGLVRAARAKLACRRHAFRRRSRNPHPGDRLEHQTQHRRHRKIQSRLRPHGRQAFHARRKPALCRRQKRP
jgi:DNA-binding transcriptional MerR regulator